MSALIDASNASDSVRTGVRLQKRLLRQMGKASQEFELVEPGDKILVGLSGGKDSYALMDLLARIQQRVPFEFELLGVNLDQGHPGFKQEVIVNWCEERGYPHHMLAQDTYSIVKEKVPEGKTTCPLCSRLRRGILYSAAQDLGCNKIALGHHKDDVIETLMLNLMYTGQLKAMPPKLWSDDGRNIVIRPLVYCDEAEIIQYAKEQAFPILPCELCGTQENMQRQNVKRMLAQWNATNDKIRGNIFAALSRVRPSHLLDIELRDLAGRSDEIDPSVP